MRAPSGQSASPSPLGVILASSAVPRVPGEIGDRSSNPADTLYETTRFEDFLRETREGLAPSSLRHLEDCRDALIRRGARRITTSCGLIWPAQERLQSGCAVPFVGSALCLLDRPGTRPPSGLCVVTIDTGFEPYWRRLKGPRLDGVRFCGLGRESYLYRALTGAVRAADFSPALAKRGIIERLHTHLAAHPETRAFLFECTNLSPYAEAVRAAFGLPVDDIHSAIAACTEPDITLSDKGPAHP